MKFLFGLFLFLSVLGDSLQKASRINRAVQEAQAYYASGQYARAVVLYRHLTDSLGVTDPELMMNLAHAAFRAGDLVLATKNYSLLTKNPDPSVQSIALTQLGLIYFQKENPERALYTFRKAIVEDPLNDNARFNYELVKKYLAANPGAATAARRRNVSQPKNKPRPEAETQPAEGVKEANEGREGEVSDMNKAGDGNPQDKVDASGQKNQPGPGAAGGNQKQAGPGGPEAPAPAGPGGGNQQGLSPDEADAQLSGGRRNAGTETAAGREKQMQTLRLRLRSADLSPEKAIQLLEAMRQAELQYLQQVPRSRPTKKAPVKPDW